MSTLARRAFQIASRPAHIQLLAQYQKALPLARPFQATHLARTRLFSGSSSFSYSEHPSSPSGGENTKRSPSRHALWYRQIVPTMIPIAIVASAVYLALHLTQGYLSHEKYLLHATDRITALEAELAEVRARAPADEWTRAYAGIVGGAASGRDEERGAGWSWKPRDWFKTT